MHWHTLTAERGEILFTPNYANPGSVSAFDKKCRAADALGIPIAYVLLPPAD
jgi:hypothetical protein